MADLTVTAASVLVGAGAVIENGIAGGTITPGTLGLQTPLNSTLLNPVLWRTNNATALAVSLDVINTYVETDY